MTQHTKEFKIYKKLKLRIGVDWYFWVVGIGVGSPHPEKDCRCIGIAVSFASFFVEIYIERNQ